jgi:hypothetical protein
MAGKREFKAFGPRPISLLAVAAATAGLPPRTPDEHESNRKSHRGAEMPPGLGAGPQRLFRERDTL